MGSYNEDRVTWYYLELKRAFLIAREALEKIECLGESDVYDAPDMATQALEIMKKEKEVV